MTAWDEMVTGQGGIRPHWRPLLASIRGLERPRLLARSDRLARMAEEEGTSHPWRCDPVPLPISAREFAFLETGLAQRARLLDALLADVYGAQATLASGALPPALVFANPGFLRACRGSAGPRGPFLHAYAADLVRSPDGEWRVVADRTDGAPGAGIAREVRRLLAQVAPELFRTSSIRGLRPFFDLWGEALLGSAPPGAEGATAVAMLTRGAADPHWPEHLLLARDLGCALVERRDLTVRDGTLLLKTLGGLKRIDVLLRRLPGHDLDSLENDGRDPAGVMGLFEAARRGTVCILNHPGAAFVEAPALAAFLPCLCRTLLGEPLRLGTVPSLWLADSGAQRMVASAFRRWAVRPAFDAEAAPVALSDLSAEERRRLQEEVQADPARFVGCTVASPSEAPCEVSGGLDARPVTLRMFLIRDGETWRAMPGGVARVIEGGEYAGQVAPADSLYKDVWVLSDEDAEIHGAEGRRTEDVRPRRSSGELPSRVADDFYWLGRYVERVEMGARVSRAGLLRRARGALLPREASEISLLGVCLGNLGVPEAGAEGLESAVAAALGASGAIGADLDHVARLLSNLRDRLTAEAHAAIAGAVRTARSELDGVGWGLDGLVQATASLQLLGTVVSGVSVDGMVRGGGRMFLELGRRIERATATARLLATVFDQPASRIDSALWLALELCDSVLTYRSRYLAQLQPGPVLDLLLADDGNPRALAYQYVQAASLLEQAGDPGLAWAAQDLIDRTVVLVDDVVAAADPVAAAFAIPPALRSLDFDTAALSNSVTRRFFALLPPVQAIGLEVA